VDPSASEEDLPDFTMRDLLKARQKGLHCRTRQDHNTELCVTMLSIQRHNKGTMYI